MNSLPHILMADFAWARLRWPKSVRPHILLGSIAPDAYRVVPGMTYQPLHFRTRRLVGERLRDFLNDHLRPALAADVADARAFWVGWLSHIIGDSVWRRMLRAELPQLWEGCLRGEPEERAQKRQAYQAACDAADRRLAREHDYVPELRWYLRAVNPTYSVEPLNPVILNQWAGVVTTEAMPPPETDAPDSQVITYSLVTRAMEAAGEEIMAVVATEFSRAERPVEDASSPFLESL